MKLKYCDGEGTVDSPWMIYNAKGIEELSTVSGLTTNVYIELCDNIDMNDTPHQQYIDIYNMTTQYIYIDGNGYEIANICRYDYNGDSGADACAIIRCTTRATIRNVNFMNFLFISCGFDTYETYTVRGFLNTGQFYNCKFVGSCKIVDVLIWSGTYFYDCVFNVTLLMYDDAKDTSSEYVIGGYYYNCVMNIDGHIGTFNNLFSTREIDGLIISGNLLQSVVKSSWCDSTTNIINIPLLTSTNVAKYIYSTLHITVPGYNVNAKINSSCYNSAFMKYDDMTYTVPNDTNRVLIEDEMRDTSILAEVGLIPIDNGGE